MPGDNARCIEQDLQSSIPGEGWAEDIIIPTFAWRTNGGLNVTGSTSPDLDAITETGNDMTVLRFDTAVTDAAVYQFQVPRQYAERQDDIALLVVARKITAENADLCLQANVQLFRPGTLNFPSRTTVTGTPPTLTAVDTTFRTLTTPARALMAAIAAGSPGAGNLTGFGTYILDIGARLKAESVRIYAGEVCALTLAPNENPDPARIHILSTSLALKRHGSLLPRSGVGTFDRSIAHATA